MKLGLALPIAGGHPVIEAARAAEDLGIDGVFVFDHYLTNLRPKVLPANDPLALLGALASSTRRIALGSLVYRAAPTPVRVSVHAFCSLIGIAGPRLIAGVGIGGNEIEDEFRKFGYSYPSFLTRTRAAAELATSLTATGIPTWVGGSSSTAERIASRCGAGLNLWNADIGSFGQRARKVKEHGIEISWAGPWAASSLTGDCGTSLSHHFDALLTHGASWAVIAPAGLSTTADLPTTYRRISEAWQSAT